MSHYQPNIQDMQFVLSHVLNAPDQLKSLPVFAELDDELVQQVLDEAGKFVGEVVAPLNRDGDEIGAQWQDGKVTMPLVFKRLITCFGKRVGRHFLLIRKMVVKVYPPC